MRRNHKFTIIMAVALLCIVILFLLWAAAPALAVAVPVEIEDGIRWAGCPLPGELQDALAVICDAEGIDPLLALGLIETESGFQPDIISPWGDYGLCQLNKAYFRTDMTPEENMEAGIGLLAANIRRYGNVEAALTAYNRGHDDGSRWYASVVLAKAAAWGYRDD